MRNSNQFGDTFRRSVRQSLHLSKLLFSEKIRRRWTENTQCGGRRNVLPLALLMRPLNLINSHYRRVSVWLVCFLSVYFNFLFPWSLCYASLLFVRWFARPGFSMYVGVDSVFFSCAIIRYGPFTDSNLNASRDEETSYMKAATDGSAVILFRMFAQPGRKRDGSNPDIKAISTQSKRYQGEKGSKTLKTSGERANELKWDEDIDASRMRQR